MAKAVARRLRTQMAGHVCQEAGAESSQRIEPGQQKGDAGQEAGQPRDQTFQCQ